MAMPTPFKLCHTTAYSSAPNIIDVTSTNWREKFQSLLHDTHACSHRCPQARVAFHHPANYKKHIESRTGDKKLPTQMAVSINKKITLHHLLAQMFTNRAEMLLSPLSSSDCTKSPMDMDLQTLSIEQN
eukprot:729302-Pelagomonas_calceolata.AAC.2